MVKKNRKKNNSAFTQIIVWKERDCKAFFCRLNDKQEAEHTWIPIFGIKEIAKVALERHTGARGLRSIMEDIMMDIMYTASDKSGKRCIITKRTVHNKKPLYKDIEKVA